MHCMTVKLLNPWFGKTKNTFIETLVFANQESQPQRKLLGLAPRDPRKKMMTNSKTQTEDTEVYAQL